MKLVSFRLNGQTSLGALSDGQVVDLHRAFRAMLRDQEDWEELVVAGLCVPPDLQDLLNGGATSMAAAKRALAYADQCRPNGGAKVFFHPLADVELLPPIRRPGKLIGVGLNYRSHLAEIDEPAPEYPVLFSKAPTSLIGHEQSIVLPRVSEQVDYEGELAVVIGRRGKYLSEPGALDHVAGYTCANDVSAHDIEFRTSQWTSGKMLDTFCPLGPALVTADEIPDPGALRLETMLNGRTVQDARTADMVFSVAHLVSYISSLATLEPGDVILTGTPAGIGCNRRPPEFLRRGDRVTIRIEGIGTLSNPVVTEMGS
jgi:acylpyruvate hydrolase